MSFLKKHLLPFFIASFFKSLLTSDFYFNEMQFKSKNFEMNKITTLSS